MMSDPRAALLALAAARGESLAALSRLIGRNAAYLQQFATRGSPKRLDEARIVGHERIDPATLRALGLAAAAAAILTAEGDSMLPTIAPGDELLIDARDREGEGLFVLRRDGALLVKRVARVSGAWQLLSDNPAYPPQSAVGAERIGRVVRLTRRLR